MTTVLARQNLLRVFGRIWLLVLFGFPSGIAAQQPCTAGSDCAPFPAIQTLAGFLSDPDNRFLVGGLATLAAASIAAFTAYWIATRVYVRQKEVDARNQFAIESRTAFRDYFRSAARLHTELRSALHRGIDREAHHASSMQIVNELYRDQDTLAISARPATLVACREYTQALVFLRNFVSKQLFGEAVSKKISMFGLTPESSAAAFINMVLDKREEAMILARAEILQTSYEQTKQDLDGILSRVYSEEDLDALVQTHADFTEKGPAA